MASEFPQGFRPRVWFLGGATAAAFGFTAVVLPSLFETPLGPTSAVFMPVVGNAVALLTWSVRSKMAYLFLAGLAGTFVTGAPPWLVGVATMVLFPLWSLLDAVMAGPQSHSLLGIEFFIYAFFTIPALIGAGVGIIARSIIRYRNVRASVLLYGA